MRRRTHPLATGMAVQPGITIGALRVVEHETHPSGGTFPGGMLVCALTADNVSIGRGLRNNVVLLDPAVSRDHAYLFHAGSEWLIENISEKGHLSLNGHALARHERHPVAPGDRFTLGNTTLELLAPRISAAGPDASTSPSSAAKGVTSLFGPGVTLQYALSRERGPLFWWLVGAGLLALFLIGGIVTAGVAAVVGRDALVASGTGRVAAAAAISLIPVAGVTTLIALADRYEREPWFLLAGAFLWGAVIAIPTAMFLEQPLTTAFLRFAGGTDVARALAEAGLRASAAAIIEECCKGAGFLVLLLALRDEFDNVTDGVLYGAAIGAGFGLIENYVYFALSPRADVQALFVGRIFLGWLGHSTFTGLLGAALGYARERHRRGLIWWGLAAGLVLAVVLHALFDFAIFGSRVITRFHLITSEPAVVGTIALLLAYLPLFIEQGALFAVLRAALAREAAVVRQYLADEVLSGCVTPDEYVLVQQATLRARAERYFLAEGGVRHYLTARALYQTVIGLAFRKWHVASGDAPKPHGTQPEDAYRARISRLRVSLWGQV